LSKWLIIMKKKIPRCAWLELRVACIYGEYGMSDSKPRSSLAEALPAFPVSDVAILMCQAIEGTYLGMFKAQYA
jgi:hypothetical protein